MEWRTPVGPLVHEHRVIERLIMVMGRELGRTKEQHRADTRFIEAATDFIRTYADRCHHGKEERILFRELAEKQLSPPLAEAMQDLMRDHVYGRELTGQLVAANAAYERGDTSALPTIESVMGQLVEFYPRHIEKEDKHFFKECLAYLTAEEQAHMLVEYDDFDRSLIHEKYLAVVEDLERESE